MSMINKFSDKIKGCLSTFDRMIFKGHFCFMHKKENRYYLLSQEKVLLKDFGKFAQKVTGEIKDNAIKIAEEANRPYIYLNSPKASKEKIAKDIMEADNVQQGLICVLGSVELCRAFSVVSNKERKELELNFMDRKCMYLYFYYLDEEFGFMHIRLQTWFPFDIRVYINGREYLSRQLDAAGISYDRYENSFLNIFDLEKAQELANRLLTKKWDRTFDNFAHKVNPYLSRINKIFGKGYFWVLDQCEYATDVNQVSLESNTRYLNALSAIEDTSIVVAELEKLCEPVSKDKKRYAGFNPISKNSKEIFLAILNGVHNINGFTNSDLRKLLYPNATTKDLIKTSGRITRLLIKLRAHKLIAKIPHSFRYKVTKKGNRIMSAALKLQRKELPQLLMAA